MRRVLVRAVRRRRGAGAVRVGAPSEVPTRAGQIREEVDLVVAVRPVLRDVRTVRDRMEGEAEHVPMSIGVDEGVPARVPEIRIVGGSRPVRLHPEYLSY